MEAKNVRLILGTNVKYYRFLIGYTQEELAEKCNLSARYMSDIENAKGNISLDTLEIIAKQLRVEPYLLLKEQNHNLNLPKRVNMKK